MLDKTYLGPARIIELSEKGATIRDTKLDTVIDVSFEHIRKIDFDELLTLLPQNFYAEIAETLGTYRYRKVAENSTDNEKEKETEIQGVTNQKVSGRLDQGKFSKLKYSRYIR
jgi:phosphoglucomutase